MPEILGKDVNRGDIVEVIWEDHYAYKGVRPGNLFVKTWGKVDEITDDGLAVVLNEVQGPLAEGTGPKIEGLWIDNL